MSSLTLTVVQSEQKFFSRWKSSILGAFKCFIKHKIGFLLHKSFVELLLSTLHVNNKFKASIMFHNTLGILESGSSRVNLALSFTKMNAILRVSQKLEKLVETLVKAQKSIKSIHFNLFYDQLYWIIFCSIWNIPYDLRWRALLWGRKQWCQLFKISPLS